VGTFRRLLVERGYRVTSQRLAIYRYLIGTDSHPTADDIYQALQKQFPTMSPATVYKTLELLVDMGLITELGFGDSANRYDGNPGLHLNLICVHCNGIADLDEPLLARLAEQAAAAAQFEIMRGRHEFYGLCASCRKELERSASQSPSRQTAG